MKTRLSVSVLVTLIVTSVAAFGQRPRQSSGLDISGDWYSGGNVTDSGATEELIEYHGIPLSEAGRLYALTWSPSRMTLPQQQCAQYEPTRLLHGGGNFRFWEDRDPYDQRLIALKLYGQITEGARTVWMDGRPHPPAYAQHTFLGFSTGQYQGTTLTVYTTHLKRNWIRTNGTTISDQATLVEHFMRHGDVITYVTVYTDPVYLTQPLIRSTEMVRIRRDPNAWLYACEDGEQILSNAHDPSKVPNYPYGQNPFLHEYSNKHHVPLLGALGGADTMYPEFLAKLKDPAAEEAEVKAELFPSQGPEHSSRAADPDPHDGEIHVLPVQGNVYMLVGDGGNIGVQIGEEGPLVVDTGTGKLAEKVIAAIHKLTPHPIQFIVNTSFHADHVGGNVKLHAVGEDPSLYGSFFSGQFADAGQGATIIGHQNVQDRMSKAAGEGAIPAEGWPSDTYVEGRRRKYHNGEAVEIFYEPNAITDGDSIVQFRRSDVIATGDIFTTTQYPFIDTRNGGTLQGEIAALNNILDKTVYKHMGEGGTLIIPGRGRLCDEYEVSEYRDMLAIFRDRVQALINQGASLDQVIAARVTADYDDRFGATSGPWTTDMFVQAIYNSLKPAPLKTASRK
jgi:glyoxylase-like metal-dependent hydrolase (beta-lactamase superfamily II)